ncbi:4Fe-4S binding protein [Heliophilum fasciatum]|uniref:2-oxoglutarate ferredoxin oxidoreductase subunit delta n=1 Tax=Heliophilum fasciatum TaxID=35700 RepID=A0A4R2SAF2_9FIRM|nr:4Fe-4S binding protein [Heliophilum fasciatum]MCW2277170.1 2-oxoglutarate ferredoxin oxidoreductase subunit delta [Heliophilum fasciatum]TCP68195.1 2-oxoglutarate ferredoxin oxidoreductase subunit delta [Heliophilum fasciatum]
MAIPAEQLKSPVTVNLAWCKGCGICYSLCPTKVLIGNELSKAVVAHPELCTSCRVCEAHCPDYAITVEGGPKR